MKVSGIVSDEADDEESSGRFDIRTRGLRQLGLRRTTHGRRLRISASIEKCTYSRPFEPPELSNPCHSTHSTSPTIISQEGSRFVYAKTSPIRITERTTPGRSLETRRRLELKVAVRCDDRCRSLYVFTHEDRPSSNEEDSSFRVF